MNLAKLRKVDCCKNMSRHQVESIFPTPFSPKSTRKPKPRPRNVSLQQLQHQLQNLQTKNDC